MQYQEILLTINILFIVLILIFIKDNYRRKLFIAPTVCAYVLAAILPYLLTWSSLNVAILFYALVIGVISLFTYDQYKSAVNRTYVEVASSDEQVSISEARVPAGEESVIQAELPNLDKEATAVVDLSEKDELHSRIDAEQAVIEVKPVDEDRSVPATELETEPEEAAEDLEIALPDDIRATVDTPQQDAEADMQPVKEGEPKVVLREDITEAVAASLQETEAEIHTVEAEKPAVPLPDDITAAVAAWPQDAEAVTQPVAAEDVSESALPDDIPAVVAALPQDSEADIEPVREDEHEVALPEDIPTAETEPVLDAEDDIQPLEAEDESESAMPDDTPATMTVPPQDAEAEPLTVDSEEHVIEEADALRSYDIEHLIELAFEARARGDYRGTLTILETILEKDPPDEIVNLILDDVEVLFAKLAS